MVGVAPDEVCCGVCSTRYSRTAGIWRLLTEEQQQRYRNFIASYNTLRLCEGWVRDQGYYLALPDVPLGDKTEHVWRIRRRSLDRAGRLIGRGNGRWALDLGAGCGWLSRYLSGRGYNTVAMDLNTEGPDGLEGVRLYMEHDDIWLGRVQASMDSLPFADASFSLCTVSAALHYAGGERTLYEISRVLERDGLLLVTDSPVYRDEAAGQSMTEEQRGRITGLLKAPPPPMPGGRGYLVEAQVLSWLRDAGFEPHLEYSESLPTLLHNALRRWLEPGEREHACFPLIVERRL